LTGIKKRFLRRKRRAKVIKRTSTVQRTKLKVMGAKLMLRQQGRENKHWIVAASHGFGIVQSWQASRASGYRMRFRRLD
jgi:hypothetical protein